jgi:excisionase family DNA binding protein
VARKQLCTIRETAEQLHISVKTAWSWRSQGKFGVVCLGRSVRVPQEEIDKLIEEGFTPARRAA